MLHVKQKKETQHQLAQSYLTDEVEDKKSFWTWRKKNVLKTNTTRMLKWMKRAHWTILYLKSPWNDVIHAFVLLLIHIVTWRFKLSSFQFQFNYDRLSWDVWFIRLNDKSKKRRENICLQMFNFVTIMDYRLVMINRMIKQMIDCWVLFFLLDSITLMKTEYNGWYGPLFGPHKSLLQILMNDFR